MAEPIDQNAELEILADELARLSAPSNIAGFVLFGLNGQTEYRFRADLEDKEIEEHLHMAADGYLTTELHTINLGEDSAVTD